MTRELPVASSPSWLPGRSAGVKSNVLDGLANCRHEGAGSGCGGGASGASLSCFFNRGRSFQPPLLRL